MAYYSWNGVENNPFNSFFSGTSTGTIGLTSPLISPLSMRYRQSQLGVDQYTLQRILNESVREYKEKKPESFNKKYGYNDDYVGYKSDNDILTRLRSETKEFCKGVMT